MNNPRNEKRAAKKNKTERVFSYFNVERDKIIMIMGAKIEIKALKLGWFSYFYEKDRFLPSFSSMSKAMISRVEGL